MSFAPNKKPAASQGGEKNVHRALMEAMNVPLGEGYNPMPVRQQSYLKDRDQPAQNRWMGLIWDCCLSKDENGQRHAHAMHKGRFLTVAMGSKLLGMTPSNGLVVVRLLEEQGRIRLEPNGSIWLNGACPKPDMHIEKESEEKANLKYVHISPEDPILLHLKKYGQTVLDRGTSDYKRLVQAQDQIKADAQALARDLCDQLEEEYYKAYLFEAELSKRGRPKKPREKTLVNVVPNELPKFVQISETEICTEVKTPSVQNENASEHISPSFIDLSETEAELASEPSYENEHEKALASDVRGNCKKLPRMEGVALDEATVRKMVQALLQLRTAGDIRHTLEALNKACYLIWKNHRDEIEKTGNVESYGWGYLVRVVQSETEKRLGVPDLAAQLKTAAAGKGW